MRQIAKVVKEPSGKVLGSSILAAITHHLTSRNKLYINLEGDQRFIDTPWISSNVHVKDAKFRVVNNILHVTLSAENKNPVYIVHNSRPRSFKKLGFAEGILAGDISSFHVCVFGKGDSTLSCSLVMLEFDSNNNRIGSVAYPMNEGAVYRPSTDTWRFVACLQFKGVGTCEISGVRLTPFGKDSLNPVSERDKRRFSSRDAEGELLPEWINRSALFVQYQDVEERMRQQLNVLAHKHNVELYKWKRRALDWEKRAREATQPRNSDSLSFEILLQLAKSLPRSNGSRYNKKIPLTVGIITDVYMFNFYRDVFDNVVYISPENYIELFNTTSFDVVLYITCWKGMDAEEWRGAKFREKPAHALEEIIQAARRQGSKLVFQSIEDPSNFEYFLPIAQKFDYVFTSDSDSIEKYRANCGHDRVFYGEYGVNPIVNNPIGSRRHILNMAFFAGSWAARYPERCEDMETIFDSILAANGRLLIADRNFDSDADNLRYPERFRACVIPPVEHELLQSMHKLFRYNLNFNSIKNSPTMCAMRVYEMQGMGVGVYSNYARSVFNNFPEIRLIPWKEDLTSDFVESDVANFEEYRRNMSLMRNVLTEKTSHDIASRMLKSIGLEGYGRNLATVCVICDKVSPAVRVNFDRQRYQSKILIEISDVRTLDAWVEFKENNRVEYFTWFSSEDEYESNYLQDLLNGFKYTNARYVTRGAWFDGNQFIDGIQHDYTTTVGGKARTLFAVEEFSPIEFAEYSAHQNINNIAGGYSIDPFELNYTRYLNEKRRAVGRERVPELSVIVPIYNNGRFLNEKCIGSLKRNKAWSSMEVLLIDDGSTDGDTLEIIDTLERENPGIVRTFSYTDGGSGSASRPRNKGIELATAPLVSFLDPDNEISPGGYDVLLQLYQEAAQQRAGGVDFVSGYHVKVEERAKPVGKHSSKRLLIIDDLRFRFLDSGKFPVVPTQPAVISKRLFDNSSLRFVERSAGQDTLFGWELLCQANAGAFTDAAFLIYYAQRSGSIINEIDSRYFQKKKILESSQTKMLARYGLLEKYVEKHYDRFMDNWYKPKLEMVRDDAERKKCAKILREIAAMYGK